MKLLADNCKAPVGPEVLEEFLKQSFWENAFRIIAQMTTICSLFIINENIKITCFYNLHWVWLSFTKLLCKIK